MDLRAYQEQDNLYSHLSLRDLLDAREQYHVHLTRLPHVVATAIGKYRVRKADSWPGQQPERHGTGVRTLENSEVRAYSWPAVLVFVDNWQAAGDFAENKRYAPDEIVPKTLYLPDGRRVPVCVIEVPRRAEAASTPRIEYPTNNIGGGYPVLADVQGRQHVATIACLVTDGHKTYALTNRHVTGEPGEVVYSRLAGKVVPIGKTAPISLTQKAFSEIYPGLPGDHARINLDAGLIEINDLERWSAKVRDIGVVEPMADISVDNVSLALLGCHVRGHGAAGGLMGGEIQGLFYRYKSSAGFEYVADLLIGPRSDGWPLRTLPGDSGTLWLVEPLPKEKQSEETKVGPRPHCLPLALQWGQNTLGGDSETAPQSFVLATFLSNVCGPLSLDLVRDWNLDQTDTWGAVGHFAIAAHAPHGLVTDNLKRLFEQNAGIIGHDDATILKGEFKGMGDDDFVPLADVPDFFWKHGKQGASRHFEGPNHFADMDQKRPSDQKTLLALCKNEKNIDPKIWDAFYDETMDLLTGEPIEPEHRGLLPFRVWQIFDAMVQFVKEEELDKFVCAAGTLAHYLGDACQPLHISYLHDGDPERAKSRIVHHRDGTQSPKKEALGVGVHAAYEDEMVNAHRKEIINALKHTPTVKNNELIASGRQAAVATVALMRRTFEQLPPKKIVSGFVSLKSVEKKERPGKMWEKFGDATLSVMVDGAHTLALLWESAWRLGGGPNITKPMPELQQEQAMEICRDRDFIPSLPINQIGTVLRSD